MNRPTISNLGGPSPTVPQVSAHVLFYSLDISEHPNNLLPVNGIPLAGFTCLRGPTSGDSFRLLCLGLLID